MAENAFQTPTSRAGRLVSDYLWTFARLLDPNLPSGQIASRDTTDQGAPAGQGLALATLGVVLIYGSLSLIIRYIA